MKPKGMWAAVALLAAMGWAGPVMAQSGSAGTNDAVEVTDAESVLTMRVDGEVVFDTQGRVIEHKVLTPKLTDDLRQFADKQLATMRFEPVKIDARPVNARTFARMTLVARPQDNGGYAIEMESVRFFKGQFSADGAPKADPADVEKAKLERSTWTVASQTRKPGYPRGLMRAGVSGAVVLRLLLREDGTVENAFVTQSALFNVRGRDKLLGQARGLFEKEALRTAGSGYSPRQRRKGPRTTWNGAAAISRFSLPWKTTAQKRLEIGGRKRADRDGWPIGKPAATSACSLACRR